MSRKDQFPKGATIFPNNGEKHGKVPETSADGQSNPVVDCQKRIRLGIQVHKCLILDLFHTPQKLPFFAEKRHSWQK